MIPNDWRSIPLSEVAHSKIVYGIVQAGPHVADGVPYLKSSDVGGQIDADGLQCTSLEIHSRYRRSAVRPGDIVISLRGNTGSTSIVPQGLPEANLTQGTARISVDDDFDRHFIHQQIASSLVQRQINAATKGSTFVEITLEDLRKVEICCPSEKSEQRRIADVLSTWDRAIETVEALITNARIQKKALMQSLLTGKNRLPGFSSPWRDVAIGDLVREVNRKVDWDDEATYKLISVRRRSEGIFHRESLSGHDILTKSMKVAKAGDFLISKMQIVHGAAALVRAEFDGFNISGSYIALVSNDEFRLSIEYFDWISKLPAFRQLTYFSSYGVHIEKMTFNLATFFRQKIYLPEEVEEQAGIVERLNAGELMIVEGQKHAAALRQEKVALMQQLLTGKRRVKVVEEAAA